MITYQIFRVNLLSSYKDSTFKIADRAFINITKQLDESYAKCPQFIDTLYYDWQKKYINRNYKSSASELSNGPEEDENWASINYISTLIFQSIEDFLSDLQNWQEFYGDLSYNESDELSWLAIFLAWCQSHKLQHIWLSQKLDYNPTTLKLIDLLFEYVNKYEVTDNKELDELTRAILNDNRYKSIKKELQS